MATPSTVNLSKGESYELKELDEAIAFVRNAMKKLRERTPAKNILFDLEQADGWLASLKSKILEEARELFIVKQLTKKEIENIKAEWKNAQQAKEILER
jgi:hypothetical protein